MRNDRFPLQDPGGLGIFLVMARALAPASFQPDFRTRWERRDPSPAASSSVAKTSPLASPRKLTLMERLDRWFWAQQQRDIEAYLARSADIHDLEERMRNLERGSWHRYN